MIENDNESYIFEILTENVLNILKRKLVRNFSDIYDYIIKHESYNYIISYNVI